MGWPNGVAEWVADGVAARGGGRMGWAEWGGHGRMRWANRVGMGWPNGVGMRWQRGGGKTARRKAEDGREQCACKDSWVNFQPKF